MNRHALALVSLAAIALAAAWDLAEFVADTPTVRDTGYLLAGLSIRAYLWATDEDEDEG